MLEELLIDRLARRADQVRNAITPRLPDTVRYELQRALADFEDAIRTLREQEDTIRNLQHQLERDQK